jgi:hypothetical protein
MPLNIRFSPLKSEEQSMTEQTVYLTFDDGPMPGSDDIIQVLNDKKVKGILFSRLSMDGMLNGKWGITACLKKNPGML